MCNHKAILLYPEFPNTFFLTYQILSDENRFGDCLWEVRHCDWNLTKTEVVKNLRNNNTDIICYYGTARDQVCEEEGDGNSSHNSKCVTPCDDNKTKWKDWILGLFCKSSKSKVEDSSSFYERTVCGYKHKTIALPKYHPRFFFIPYDFDVFENVFESEDISVDGIYTQNDITNIPDWNNGMIIDLLKERGIQKPLFSDTMDQAGYLERIINEKCSASSNEKLISPIRVYYYGAPLTIFYLKLFPNFLPVRIDDEDKLLNDCNYNSYFDTFIHIYYKNYEDIDNLVESIRAAIFSAYVDAIGEPRMLTPMFRLYREHVPRGQFYTMRSVNDFAKAITLHCSPGVDKIQEEIWGSIESQQAEKIKKMHDILLKDFNKLTSKSSRNEDRQRVNNLAKIKQTAFGCKVFLLVKFYNVQGKDYFEVLSNPNKAHVSRMLPREFHILYHSIVSCLTWEYLLSINGLEVEDVSNAVLSNKRNVYFDSNGSQDFTSLFLRFKKDEKKVIEQYTKFKVKSSNIKYTKNDLEKLIGYTEIEIEQYVDDAVLNMSCYDQKQAYQIFNSYYSSRNLKAQTIFREFLTRIKKYKYYHYI